jgi:hypothetical protein
VRPFGRAKLAGAEACCSRHPAPPESAPGRLNPAPSPGASARRVRAHAMCSRIWPSARASASTISRFSGCCRATRRCARRSNPAPARSPPASCRPDRPAAPAILPWCATATGT